MTHEEFRRAIYPHDYKVKSGRFVIVRDDAPDIEIKTYEFSIMKRRQEVYDRLILMGLVTPSFQ